MLGQPVDFSGSVEADQVNFKLGNDSQSVDAFLFDGEGYARYGLYYELCGCATSDTGNCARIIVCACKHLL